MKRSELVDKLLLMVPVCLALFFARTVFIGYKYLFFFALVPCLAASFFVIKNNMRNFVFSWKMLLPALTVACYLINFTTISNVEKETVNILFIIYFLFLIVYSRQYVALLKLVVWLVEFAGVVAICRCVVMTIGFDLPQWLFEGKTFSLVRDNNFYTLCFILSLIAAVRLCAKNKIKTANLVLFSLITIVNVVASFSRRGFVLYALVMLGFVIVIFASVPGKQIRKPVLACVLTNAGFAVIALLSMFLMKNTVMRMLLSDYTLMQRTYKLTTIFVPDKTLGHFRASLWSEYGKNKQDTANLFYNGDFADGTTFWTEFISSRDTLKKTFVKNPNGNYLRIERIAGNSNFSLFYSGRPIYYHKGLTYELSLKYRTIKGEGAPFAVGWWVNEGGKHINDLPKNIEPLADGWNLCTVSHTFESDCNHPECFLNAQKAGSIIEVKDISLTCNDTANLFMYVDESPDCFDMYSDTINHFIYSRTDRWRYALELWQIEYGVKQKFFGNGFDYLAKYGQRFYNNANRYDFPHNPIISAFLYSGIVGGVAFFATFVMSFVLYWKSRKKICLCFILYLCCTFFCMFSGNSVFSFPLFAFLMFIPFFERKDNDETINNEII